MDRAKLAKSLHELAKYLELVGENPFKVRAHENAAHTIEEFEGDLVEQIKNDTLTDLQGIGPALKEKIIEFYKTGAIAEIAKIQKKLPPGLVELVRIPNLGPKRARFLIEKLGIKSVGELEYACNENRLLKLKGFGEKSQARILQ